MRTIVCTVTVCLVLAAGCADDGSEDSGSAGDVPAAGANGEPAPMPPMPGMPASAQPVADGMEQHLTVMTSVSTDSLTGLLPTHRQMAANMLADMNKEMRDMNMTADAAWSAALDSVRADLRVMPDLAPGQLKSMLPTHVERLRRLKQMHPKMIAH